MQLMNTEARDVASLSNEDLLAELASAIDTTARHVSRLALVWAELEKRGVDLSTLRSGLRVWLPVIAAGRLAAEVVVSFAGNGSLIRALADLPLAAQRAHARGEEQVVVECSTAV